MKKKNKKNILVTGSLALDYIMDFEDSFEKHILTEKLKTLSVSFALEKLSRNFGGVAGNIAYNFSLLNINCSVLSSCGETDSAPYLKHFKKNKIDISYINRVKKAFTANAFMITDKNNCQISGFYKGALEKDLSLRLPLGFDLLIVGATIPKAMVSFVKQAKKSKTPFIFAPGQEITHFSKEELLEGITDSLMVIANDYEMALIFKISGLTKKQLLDKTSILITTLGNYGSEIATKNQSKSINIGIAKPDKILDPTGAGDSYVSGFATGYVKNYDLKTCGQLGAALASFAIERYGTQNHKFTLNEFNKRYKNNFAGSVVL